MQNKKPWLYLAAVAVVLLALKYSDTLFGGIRLFFSLLVPLFIGCGVAYVLNILVARLEKLPPLHNPQSKVYPFRRGISITGALLIILLVLALLVVIIIPQIVDAFRVMLINVPPAVNEFLAWLNSLNIDLPQLVPMIVLQLIMSASNLMNVGFEKAYLLQTELNKATSDIIAVYVYEQGILNAKYSYSTAIGLFNTLVNIALLFIVTRIARKVADYKFI